MDEEGKIMKMRGAKCIDPILIKYMAPKNGETVGHYQPVNPETSVRVTGKHTCLLDAVAAQCPGSSTESLRKDAVSYIKKNPSSCNDLFEKQAKLGERDSRRLYVGGSSSGQLPQHTDITMDSYDESTSSDAGLGREDRLAEKIRRHLNENHGKLPREKVLKYFSNLAKEMGNLSPTETEDGQRRNNTQIGKKNHRYLELHMKKFKNYNGEDLLPGIELEESFKKGDGYKRGIVDVIDHNNKLIIDYKFGNAKMSSHQYEKYSTKYPGYSIYTLHGNGEYKLQDGRGRGRGGHSEE